MLDYGGTMKDIFKTKAGRLTPYALACGYIEKHETKPGTLGGSSVTLWLEHGTLHVRQHNRDTGKRVFWECFERLTDARKCFDRAKKSLQSA